MKYGLKNTVDCGSDNRSPNETLVEIEAKRLEWQGNFLNAVKSPINITL